MPLVLKFQFIAVLSLRKTAVRLAVCLCTIMLLLIPAAATAEGSKELTANGGNRAYLLSSTNANTSFPFPTPGTMKVYAKAGESIYVGSSAQGKSSGTINLRAPDGSTYTSGASTTTGLISNRSQEVAGPQPNGNGYQPFIQPVAAGQEGVWEIDFISPTGGADQNSNPAPVAAYANWTQPNSQYVTAFDVSVRNAGNTAFLTGRVFTNVLSGILGNFITGFNAILNIVTRDGYLYTLDNNGQAGNGFTFFVNNKGFRNTNGSPSYQSVNNTINPDVQDPRSADTQSDITHKIFFNAPAADLPASAATPGGTTWLLNIPVKPEIAQVQFTGTEGTPGKAGTAPLGGNITFTATTNGTYTIGIDVNRNGIFNDPVDRQLTGIVNAGSNQVSWDGMDGQGNKVPAIAADYNVTVGVSLYAAEVHFPFFDVERNVNGIKLTRINGANAPEYTIHWDDSPIIVVGTPSNPVKNVNGISSLTNGHKWGATTTEDNDTDFGNNKSIDTWAYASVSPANQIINFRLQEADLEVTSITSAINCNNRQVTCTVAVKNNGPADITGSKFMLNLPAGLTNMAVSSTATQGVSTVTAEASTAGQYTATLNMANGSSRTFQITGNINSTSAVVLNETASMLRPADVTDLDATNPDAAPPADAAAECNALPSGTGCNNIKVNTVTAAPIPNAGANQSVVLNSVVTLTANAAGTWAQATIAPAQTTIATPAATETKVSGFTVPGRYTFLFTNSNGCTATVNIDVFSAETTVPNIITPNGDGKNDVLEIANLSFYPGSQLVIFNRWGNEVYRSENYQNNWSGSGLADGTYYYLLNRKELSGKYTAFKGWIYLKR